MKQRCCRNGFTLLEVLVSVSLFSIGALALARSFATHLAFNGLNAERSEAVLAVEQVVDQLRTVDPRTMPTGGSELRQTTIGNHTYDVLVKYCSPSTYCTSSNIRAIHCEASLRGQIKYAVDTVFAQLK